MGAAGTFPSSDWARYKHTPLGTGCQSTAGHTQPSVTLRTTKSKEKRLSGAQENTNHTKNCYKMAVPPSMSPKTKFHCPKLDFEPKLLMLFVHEIYRCKTYIFAFAPYESYKKTTHLNQGLTEDPPAPDRPPPPPPTFSSSSWDHEVYAVEIIPLGGGYLEGERVSNFNWYHVILLYLSRITSFARRTSCKLNKTLSWGLQTQQTSQANVIKAGQWRRKME